MNTLLNSPLQVIAPLLVCCAVTACGGGSSTASTDAAVQGGHDAELSAPSLVSVPGETVSAPQNEAPTIEQTIANAEATARSADGDVSTSEFSTPSSTATEEMAAVATPSAFEEEARAAVLESLPSAESGNPAITLANAEASSSDAGTAVLYGLTSQSVSAAGSQLATDSATTTLATADAGCAVVPPMPTPPAGAKKVTDFGAKPNDDIDDTLAIQNAIKSLQPGEWLVFPPGRYIHNNVLRMRVANTKLYGKGATLHATNPDNMAVMLSADNTAVYGFTLTAVTKGRQSAPWTARIAIFKDDTAGNKLPTYNAVIQGNNVTYAGAPGTSTANSASSAGIMVYKGYGFLVANNQVSRTLADGIHVTGGSQNGRIMNNKVRETGDDMISVVSYAQGAPAALQTATALRANWDNAKATSLSRNVQISGNDVAGNYWGRGITVVGGEQVTIKSNKVSGVAGSAGILLAREHNYRTFGVNNVIVEANSIDKIQSVAPVYNPGNKFTGISQQGSIEFNSFIFEDEWNDSFLRDQLSVRNVVARQNNVRESVVGGLRSGVVLNGTLKATDPKTGLVVGRVYRTGDIKKSTVEANTMSATKYGIYLITPSVNTSSTYCSGNLLDGVASNSSACQGAKVAITGATPSCTAAGLPNVSR